MKRNLLALLASNKAAPARQFTVRALDGGEAEILLYDVIVDSDLEAEWFGGVTPSAFLQQLRDTQASTIHLRINSPGGSVFAARAMEAALREHSARIVVHVDGLAASAASFLAMAGDEIIMSTQGSMLMIHKAWTGAWGNADDLLQTAALLEKIDGTLAQTYANRTGQKPDDVLAAMAAETWFTAEEAVAAGYADSIAADQPVPANAWNLSAFAHAPAQAKAKPPAAKHDPTPALRARIDASDRRADPRIDPALTPSINRR
jgi:ATP-dependent Clp protease protease subunit